MSLQIHKTGLKDRPRKNEGKERMKEETKQTTRTETRAKRGMGRRR